MYFFLVFFLSVIIGPIAAHASIDIKWKVANPFRLFVHQSDTDAHRAAYEAWLSLPASERERRLLEGRGPINFAEIEHFAARHAPGPQQLEYLKALKEGDGPYRGWAEAIIAPGRNRTCFDQASQQYSACEQGASQAKQFAGGSYVVPKYHRVEIWLEGTDVLPNKCVWSWVDVKSGSQATKPPGRCADRVLLDVPYKEGMRISVRNGDTGGLLVSGFELAVKDVLIVGLGDSFASGEGNPDYPVRLARDYYNHYEAYLTTHDGDARDWCLALAKGNSSVASADCGALGKNYLLGGYPTRAGTKSNYENTPFRTIRDYFDVAPFRKKPSTWLSTACHRSLYSYQVRVALQLALEDDQRAVTFLGYACSGAEILDGLLVPEEFGLEKEPDEAKRVDISQLSAASHDLCRGQESVKTTRLATELRSAYSADLFDPTPSVAAKKFKANKNATALICNAKEKRKVDLVLLTFGGNDIGFVPLIGHIIAGHDKDIDRWGQKVFKILYGADGARRRMEMLASRYAAADKAIQAFLNVKSSERDRILATAYPPMAYDETGKICGGGFFASNDKRTITPVAAGMDVHPLFRFNESEAKDIQAFTANKSADGLHGRMQMLASKNGWTFVDSYVGAFAAHGICAQASLPATASTEQKLAEELHLPRCRWGRDGKCTSAGWLPYSPNLFSPYVSRQRWIRTPNDAFLADHFHSEPGAQINQRASWRLVASAAYSGAFHPTAEGQSIVADAVLLRARCALLKHDGVSNSGKSRAALYAHCS